MNPADSGPEGSGSREQSSGSHATGLDGGPTLFVLVGLPGAGKTTRAKQIAVDEFALRLSPDEWMIPLFGESDAGGKRDVLEGRLIWAALQLLRLGTNVVLDFGVWTADERWALRAAARSVGARCRLIYLPIGEREQRRRVVNRFALAAHTTFEMSAGDLANYRDLFQPPTQAELDATALPDPPAGHSSWSSWAAERWPSLPDPA